MPLFQFIIEIFQQKQNKNCIWVCLYYYLKYILHKEFVFIFDLQSLTNSARPKLNEVERVFLFFFPSPSFFKLFRDLKSGMYSFIFTHLMAENKFRISRLLNNQPCLALCFLSFTILHVHVRTKLENSPNLDKIHTLKQRLGFWPTYLFWQLCFWSLLPIFYMCVCQDSGALFCRYAIFVVYFFLLQKLEIIQRYKRG